MLTTSDINKLVSALSNVFSTKSEFAELKGEFDNLEKRFDTLEKRMDTLEINIIAEIHSLKEEDIIGSGQYYRHDKWIHQLADHTSCKLE
ncbi:hypothetical protein A2997_02235 [Candidatus Nomurabacteria bacterium RIFCSPLOWO2_01_FULL_36_10b]|uniref:Uncharacterized protein n=1 Tax=Candidatus Nomurabacteria bacterium RIFCSPLOWO2_01_FULL_36_10b TaxID=1801766 RepID=A0A1F6WN18_9BACT|nr:MAG: hypothetical protein A2997_02235 [Candidatus Nomurabacteria bacterium RIFCSPLOWO2_01_FULL_36_10b]